MKYLFSLLACLPLAALLLLAAPATHAQAPAWQTAAAATSATGRSEVYESAADASGSVFVTGVFMGTVAFGGTTLTSAGRNDVFVAKWSSATGTFVWAVRAGGPSDDQPYGLAASNGAVFVSGSFGVGTADFGTTMLTSVGSEDVFVAKLVDAGAVPGFAWAVRAGGGLRDVGYGIAVSGSSVYVSGTFAGHTAFGSAVLTSAGDDDVFVTKLTDAGTSAAFVWAERAGGTGLDQSYGLAVSGPNVYVCGPFSEVANFGSTVLTSAGNTDLFVARLTDAGTSGSFIWARGAGGSDNESATVMTANGSNVYVAGWLSSPAVSFGGTTLSNTNSFSKLFVAKLVDAGATPGFTWAQQSVGTGSAEPWGLRVSSSGVYLAGSFRGTVGFGSTSLASAGSTDVFAAQLLDAGPNAAFGWAQRGGGAGPDSGYGLALQGTTAFVSGGVMPPASFGTLPVTGAGTDSMGFLASLANAVLATSAFGALPAFALAPNPAHGTATVQLPIIPGAATATITVLDALGRAVRTQTAAANAPAELDLSGLPAGLYAVRVAAGGATATQRLVVE